MGGVGNAMPKRSARPFTPAEEKALRDYLWRFFIGLSFTKDAGERLISHWSTTIIHDFGKIVRKDVTK